MPKKLMDCVDKVKKQGKDESSAYAICVDSTGLKPEHHEKGIDPSYSQPSPQPLNSSFEEPKDISGLEALKKDEEFIGKHNDVCDCKFDPEQLAMGIEVEKEHTDDIETAKKIAKDHLSEIPDYYSRLKKMEEEAGVKEEKEEKSGDFTVTDLSLSKGEDIVAFNDKKGNGVDLKDHLLATQDDASHLYLEYIKKLIALILIEGQDFINNKKFSSIGYSEELMIDIRKQEANLYSGKVYSMNGGILLTFENQTPELIASMMRAKLGDFYKDLDIPIEEDLPEQNYLDDDFDIEFEQMEDGSLLFPEESKVVGDNLNTSHIRLEIPSKFGNILINIEKSKEIPMSFIEDLTKAIGAIKDKKQSVEEDKNEKSSEEKEPEVVGETAPNPSEEEKPTEAEEGSKESEEKPEDASLEVEEEEKDSTEEPKEDVLKEVESKENPEDSADDSMEPADNVEANLQYIKMSEFDGGKQYWYKDPTSGRIYEKDNAPSDHPDFNSSSSLQELQTKVEELEAKVQELTGESPKDQEKEMENKDGAPVSENKPEESSAEEPQESSEDKEESSPKMGLETPSLAATEEPKSEEASPEMEPKKDEEEKKPEDKMKKSLKVLYPDVSDEKIEEIVKAALEGKEIIEENTSTPVETISEEKVLKKSKYSRMWKISGVDMPENLDNEDNINKANDGIKKLHSFVMNQGKSSEEAIKIVNRAVIEKYDALGKGFASFKNISTFAGYSPKPYEGKDAASVRDLRIKECENRFGLKEFIPEEGMMVINKSTDINSKIEKMLKPEPIQWDLKEYKEPINKSTPSDFEKSQMKKVEDRWNVPEYKEIKKSAKDLVKEVDTQIADKIKKSMESKSITFKNVKEYDESLVKAKKAAKTESEEKNEELEKRIWKK